jgi:hypothetical protein
MRDAENGKLLFGREWTALFWRGKQALRAKIKFDRLGKEARPASHLGQPHKSLLVWAMLNDQ